MSSPTIVLPGASLKDTFTETFVPPPSPPGIFDNATLRPLRQNANSGTVDYNFIYDDITKFINFYNNINFGKDYEIDGLKNLISQLNEITIPLRIKNITPDILEFYLSLIKDIYVFIDNNSFSSFLCDNPNPLFEIKVINIELFKDYIYKRCNHLY